MAAIPDDEQPPLLSSFSSLSSLSDWVSSTYSLSSSSIENVPFSLSFLSDNSSQSIPQQAFHIIWLSVSGEYITRLPLCDDLKERHSVRQGMSQLGNFVSLKVNLEREGLLPVIAIVAYGGSQEHASALLSAYKSDLRSLLHTDSLASEALRRLLIHPVPICGFSPHPEASPLILSVCRDNAPVLQMFLDILFSESEVEKKESGIEMDQVNEQLRVCLRTAAEEGRTRSLSLLLKFLPESFLSEWSMEAIHGCFSMEMMSEREKIETLHLFIPIDNATPLGISISKKITTSSALLRVCVMMSSHLCLRHLLTHFAFTESAFQISLLFACEVGSVDGVKYLLEIGRVNPEFTVTSELREIAHGERFYLTDEYDTPMKLAIAHRPTLSQAISPMLDLAFQRRSQSLIADCLHSHGSQWLENEEEVEGKRVSVFCSIL